MKKIYAFLLAVILLCSALASVACACHEKESPKPVICLGEIGGGGYGGIPGSNAFGDWQKGRKGSW